MRPYDLLVFDWDGTLVDSIGSIVACAQQAFEDLGLPPVSDARVRRTIGLGIREMIDELVPGCDDALFERICKAYRRHWFADFSLRHAPFTGVGALLETLAEGGYLLGVATAKGRGGLQAELERTGLDSRIHASRTVDEAPPKPHPGMLESLMSELATQPERTLMIGDTTHDLEMAANAGVPGVGVLSGSHTSEQLLCAPHLSILGGVLDLPAWLAGSPAGGRRRDS